LKPKILEFLQPAAPLEISIHPDVRDGATVDAALGFANQAARDAAANRIAAAKQAGELSWRPFKGRSKETVKVAYSSLVDHISKLLVEQRDVIENEHLSGRHFNLKLLLWADNADAITVVKFRLIDNTATLFPNSRSPLAPLLELVGGEQTLP